MASRWCYPGMHRMLLSRSTWASSVTQVEVVVAKRCTHGVCESWEKQEMVWGRERVIVG